MAEERWTIAICPVHREKLREGFNCIEVVGRDDEGIAQFCHRAERIEVVPEARAKKAEEQRDRLLSAYKVWKDATLKRCKLLSSRESSDSMLFPDQAFIETADRIAREVRDDG